MALGPMQGGLVGEARYGVHQYFNRLSRNFARESRGLALCLLVEQGLTVYASS